MAKHNSVSSLFARTRYSLSSHSRVVSHVRFDPIVRIFAANAIGVVRMRCPFHPLRSAVSVVNCVELTLDM